MSACRSCGASIRWAKVATSGKSIPLDAEPVANGNLVFRLAAGDDGSEVIYVRAPSEGGLIGDEYAGRRFISHFVTCPNAGQHRKAKR
jgi:hypothetical protein